MRKCREYKGYIGFWGLGYIGIYGALRLEKDREIWGICEFGLVMFRVYGAPFGCWLYDDSQYLGTELRCSLPSCTAGTTWIIHTFILTHACIPSPYNECVYIYICIYTCMHTHTMYMLHPSRSQQRPSDQLQQAATTGPQLRHKLASRSCL